MKNTTIYSENAQITTRSLRLIPVLNPPAGPRLTDPAEAVREALESIDAPSIFANGDRVAVATGSRGIDRLVDVLRATVDILKGLGARPFICPAMGSHGGGTAAGRTALLASLGVTAETTGAEIVSDDETVSLGATASLGATDSGIPLFMSRPALEADRIVVVNRVKPHTRFTGAIQSGLCKMTLVGLGNSPGARATHAAALRTPFPEIAREALPVVAAKAPLAAGIALVENGRKELATISAVRADGFPALDADRLADAAAWLPRIPADEIDLLIVDRMGKEISGTGMDTNVIGRKEDAPTPRVLRIFVGDLTDASAGNATGIGFADAATRALAAKIDRTATRLNCFTAQRPEGARIPALFANDRDAIDALLATTGRRDAAEVRVVRIAGTSSLERIAMSPALVAELGEAGDGAPRAVGPAELLRFDEDGFLEDFNRHEQDTRYEQDGQAPQDKKDNPHP